MILQWQVIWHVCRCLCALYALSSFYFIDYSIFFVRTYLSLFPPLQIAKKLSHLVSKRERERERERVALHSRKLVNLCLKYDNCCAPLSWDGRSNRSNFLFLSRVFCLLGKNLILAEPSATKAKRGKSDKAMHASISQSVNWFIINYSNVHKFLMCSKM